MAEPFFTRYLEHEPGVNNMHRFNAARGLSRAARANPQLERELPYVARNYGSTARAYRRLGSVAGLTGPDYLVQTIQSAAEKPFSPDAYIGFVSVERGAPGLTGGLSSIKAAELSFWHGRAGQPQDEVIGAVAIQSGLELPKAMHQLDTSTEPINTVWTLTLPDDQVKAGLLADQGFEPLDVTQTYNVSDGVTEPRQLWVRPAIS